MKMKDAVTLSLLTKLGIQDIDVMFGKSRMKWHDHVERSTGWITHTKVRRRRHQVGQMDSTYTSGLDKNLDQ